jgi:hypothetical protein
VTVRVHHARVVIWRDATRLAAHARAPDGGHQRVVEPAHYSLLFAKKPRAQVMLYREALLQLGPSAKWYLSEVSRRRRASLREEVVGIYTLYQQLGAARLLAAMDYATEHSAYGVDYLRAVADLAARSTPATWPLLLSPPPAALWPTAEAPPASTAALAPTLAPVMLVSVAGLPPQDEVDRALDVYECYVQVDGHVADSVRDDETTVALLPAAALAEPAESVVEAPQ